ncbi:MAG TPA: hypothetical protein VHK01_12910 [Lacipirellulaceae bacterium]|jgi:hypothetical protein|nr:hypothetical protein [Lacipirellulaceae bacterium]
MKLLRYFGLFAALVSVLTAVSAAERELPVLLEEDFEQGMDRWQTTDPDDAEPVWKIIEVGKPGNHALRVTGTSKYQPPYRSPHSIALLKDIVAGDFELTARVQETNVDAGPHRDLCIFWGYQDPSHFYYVHFGAQADPHACQIFIVNDAPRKMITVHEAKGTPWTEGWHTVKVVRRVNDGTINVYFDDMEKPFMTAKDKTFTWGQVGVGTFDDHGNFDDITLRGVRVEQKK